jgi:hypothetical protein
MEMFPPPRYMIGNLVGNKRNHQQVDRILFQNPHRIPLIHYYYFQMYRMNLKFQQGNFPPHHHPGSWLDI